MDRPTFLQEMVDFREKNARMEETSVINTVVGRARYRALRLADTTKPVTSFTSWTSPL